MLDFVDDDIFLRKLIINSISKDKIDKWNEILNIINNPVKHEIVEMFNDEYKKKVYDYINKFKNHYLKYSKNELDAIRGEYQNYKKNYLENLYLLYQIPDELRKSTEWRGNIGYSVEDPKKDKYTDRELIIQNMEKIFKLYVNNKNANGQIFFVKKQENEFKILNSTCHYVSIKNNYHANLYVNDIKKISIEEPNLKEIVNVELQTIVETYKISNFFIISFDDFYTAFKPKNYILKYEEKTNKFYLCNKENNESFYDKNFIREKLLLKDISIDSNLSYVNLDDINHILDEFDNDNIIWCIAHRGHNVIYYGYSLEGYIQTNGVDIEPCDDPDYKPELIKRYLKNDPNVIIYWDSFTKNNISKEQLILYMNVSINEIEKVTLSKDYYFYKNYPNHYVISYMKDEDYLDTYISITISKIHKSGLLCYRNYSVHEENDRLIKLFLENKLENVVVNNSSFPNDKEAIEYIKEMFNPDIKYMITIRKNNIKLLVKRDNIFTLECSDDYSYINKYLEGDKEIILDTFELSKNISSSKIKECLVKNSLDYDNYVEYIKSLDNKHIIGIPVKKMFKNDEYFIEKEKEYEKYDGFEYNSIYNKQTILDELLVYKNGKIIKNENNLYVELIQKYNSGDENIVLDEWSILGRFYDPEKLIDDYLKNKCV